MSHAKKYIIINIIWQWIALLSQIAAVFAIANLLQDIVGGTVSEQVILRTIVILICVVVLRFICDRFASRASYQASVDVKRILRKHIYEKLLCLGMSYREKVATSEVVQLSTEGVEQLETYFGRYLPQLFYSLLAPITLFIVLSFVNLKACITLLICVPLIPISIVAVQKFAKKLLNKYWGIYANLGDSFLENLQGLTTLKIYQADGEKAEQMDEESQNFRKITMKVLTMQLNSTSVMDIIAYGGAAIGMIVAVYDFLQGHAGFAGTVAIVLLASEFFIPLRLLGSFFHIAMNGMAASDKIFALLDLPDPKKGSRRITDAEIHIQLSDVHFSYEKDREVLSGINLSLTAGSFVALVGTSGCGKSTIAGLLMGENKGYQGSVQINEVPLAEITEESRMENITLVRHNSYLFKGTVEENLKMAKPDATIKEMEAALKKVNLLDFLKTQKNLQTVISENAGNLSGGQRQRLALARALLHDSPVYIFDEATSNIDAESEELIMDVIYELAKSKTVLLISHRLSNVISSDCIYMLRNGVIVEHGTHEELMEMKGAYQKMYASQKNLEAFSSEKKVENYKANNISGKVVEA